MNGKLKQSLPTFKEPELPFVRTILIKDYNELYAKIYDKEKFVNM